MSASHYPTLVDQQKIAILGGNVGNKNLGDETTVAAVIQNIRHRYPHAKICAFTTNPDDTQQRHKIAAFPLRRKDKNKINFESSRERHDLYETAKIRLKTISLVYYFLKGIYKCLYLFFTVPKELKFVLKSFRILKGTDLLIVAGGGQLSDYWGGPWGYPYTIFKWALIARASGTKLVFLSVGAGPINSLLSKLFFKYSLSLASYRSYRDGDSRKLIQEIGVSGENLVFPDLAYSFRMVNLPSVSAQSQSRPVVGINPLPFLNRGHWPESSDALYKSYVQTLAYFALWLMRRNHTVVFFPTQLQADPPVIRDIILVMEDNGGIDYQHQIIHRPVLTFGELISEISLTDIVVATRFHGILLSYLLKKPVLGIAYHRKADNLMKEMGQSDYILDINRLDSRSLIDRFRLLESNSEVIKDQIERRIVDHRSALEVQYDHVLGQGGGATTTISFDSIKKQRMHYGNTIC